MVARHYRSHDRITPITKMFYLYIINEGLAHIVPEWYFLPIYAILRSISNKSGGVVAIGLVLLW